MYKGIYIYIYICICIYAYKYLYIYIYHHIIRTVSWLSPSRSIFLNAVGAYRSLYDSSDLLR